MPDREANRLESWKEIATFLGRDKRTAMRWAENHAMPVHRFPGYKQARVFAYRDELTAWLQSFTRPETEQPLAEPLPVKTNGSASTAQVNKDSVHVHNGTDFEMPVSVREPSESSPTVAASPSPQTALAGSFVSEENGKGETNFLRSLWQRRFLFGVVTGTFVIVLGVIAWLQPSAKLAAGSRTAGLIQLTDDGRAKESLRTDGTTLFFDEIVGHARVLASAPIEGGPVHPISSPFGDVSLMDVSQDGKSLLVASNQGVGSPGQLWQLPTRGGTPNPIGQVRCFNARLSPDETQIAFSTGNGLYITDAGGREPHSIGSFETKPYDLIWSSDGRRLRFIVENVKSHSPSAWEIDFRPRGTFRSIEASTTLLFHSPCCTHWTWLGDDKEFAYVVQQDDGRVHLKLRAERSLLPGWRETETEFTSNFGRIDSLASGKTGS